MRGPVSFTSYTKKSVGRGGANSIVPTEMLTSNISSNGGERSERRTSKRESQSALRTPSINGAGVPHVGGQMARRKPVRLNVWKRKWEYPKGSGNWKEAWTITYKDRYGEERRETPHPDNKKLTELRADQIRKELMDGYHVAPSETVTVEQALGEFYAQCRREGKKGGTLKGYNDCIENHILPRFGRMLIADLGSEDVRDLINELIDEGHQRTPGLVRSILMRTCKMCIPKYLVRNVLVDDPVVIGSIDREPIYIPTHEEAKALFGALEHRHNTKDDYEQHHAWALRRLMILMAALAGLRRGEIQGLHWRNINLKTRMIEVRHSWSPTEGLGETKTKAGIRDVPLDWRMAFGLEPLWDYQQNPSPNDMIFLTSRGRPAYGCMYESYFKTSMRHAGLLVPRENGGATDRQRDRGHTPKFSLHALRHWAISSWILDGIPIPRVARWAGHAHPGVTMKVYARVIESMENLEIDRQRLEMNGNRLLGQSRLLEGPLPKFLKLTTD